MNYYPFHIGDYVSATRHLSWDEDAAYRRLLDVYYTHEEPLPIEERKVFRLVMATTDDQREAVRVVLDEFFVKTPAGWVNRRADIEIAAMRELSAKQREKANKRWKKTHQNDDAGMPRSDVGGAPGEPRQEQHNATASFYGADAMPPTPTPTPTPEENTALLSASAGGREDDPPDDAPAPSRPAALTLLLRPQGVDVTPSHPHVLAWAKRGLSDEEALEATARARERKPLPARISAGYLNCIVGDILDDRAKNYPAGASTPPGPLSMIPHHRGQQHAKKSNVRSRVYAIASLPLPRPDSDGAGVLGAVDDVSPSVEQRHACG